MFHTHPIFGFFGSYHMINQAVGILKCALQAIHKVRGKWLGWGFLLGAAPSGKVGPTKTERPHGGLVHLPSGNLT